jgi:hypothetical protein
MFDWLQQLLGGGSGSMLTTATPTATIDGDFECCVHDSAAGYPWDARTG